MYFLAFGTDLLFKWFTDDEYVLVSELHGLHWAKDLKFCMRAVIEQIWKLCPDSTKFLRIDFIKYRTDLYILGTKIITIIIIILPIPV